MNDKCTKPFQNWGKHCRIKSTKWNGLESFVLLNILGEKNGIERESENETKLYGIQSILTNLMELLKDLDNNLTIVYMLTIWTFCV